MALFGRRVDEDGLIRSCNPIVVARIVLQICINTQFLALPLHLKYGVNLSVFTAKNVIMVLNTLFKIISFSRCCEKQHEIEVIYFRSEPALNENKQFQSFTSVYVRNI